MKLNEVGLSDKEAWRRAGYKLPEYDRATVKKRTMEHPFWLHLGAGNLFRAFQAKAVQELLNQGVIDRGLIAAEGFDGEIIDRVNRKTDDYSILVTLCADASMRKEVIGSVVESLHMDMEHEAEYRRLKEVFCKPSLQMVSFTITEKGYSLKKADGTYLPAVEADLAAGPKKPVSYMGKTAALLYERYLAGRIPIAMVSMDNCSQNGSRLFEAIHTFAEKWTAAGQAETGFLDYIGDAGKVSFPWTMIDKITPRPDAAVAEVLKKDGLCEAEPFITAKQTYTAPFVNAEESEYLVIEDAFPNGRPQLESAGIYFTDRKTVDKTEKMKVGTCLNPLHTALAVFGCLLNYPFISDAAADADLEALLNVIGYREGLAVVNDPGIICPQEFLDTVLRIRIPNPYMPDTPKRITTDTSQKLAVRFGETIRSYQESPKLAVTQLEGIPLILAGWLRYLLAVDDNGSQFALSPDPMLDYLCKRLERISLGQTGQAAEALKPLFLRIEIFGVDLYEAGLAQKVCTYFTAMAEAPGAVRKVLHRFAGENGQI